MDILQTFKVELMSTNTKRFCSITNTCSNRTVYNVSILCKTVLHIPIIYDQTKVAEYNTITCIPVYDQTKVAEYNTSTRIPVCDQTNYR